MQLTVGAWLYAGVHIKPNLFVITLSGLALQYFKTSQSQNTQYT